MVTVHRPGECSLFGTRFPIIGTVQPVQVEQFAEKRTTGDPSKEDSGGSDSTWIFAGRLTGGIGVLEMLEKKDPDRSWWSTMWLNSNNHTLLPALVTQTSKPSGVGEPTATREFNNRQYVAFATDLRLWAESTSSYGATLGTLAGTPTDSIIHRRKLYFAGGSDFNRYDGSTLTTGAVLGSAQPCRYFVEWDDKLFTLDNTGQLDWTMDEGVTWIEHAKSDLPDGSFNSLWVGRDAAGNFVVYMGTSEGAFALDFDGVIWKKTELTWPQTEFGGQGADHFEDASYVPTGMRVQKYRPGDPNVFNVGLDRDDGTPQEYRGNIIRLVPTLGEMFAIIDATSDDTRDLFPAAGQNAYGNISIVSTVGRSIVARYVRGTSETDPNRDGSWTIVFAADTDGLPSRTAVASTADGKYRLWFGMAGEMHHVDLQRTAINPTEIDGYQYDAARTIEHLTPRFDADKATADKLGRRVVGRVSDCSVTEYFKINYRIDDDTAWTTLTNSDFPDGQIDSNGQFTMVLGTDDLGVPFDTIQFQILPTSGSNSLSPDLRWARLEYLKTRVPRFAFGVRIDATRNYRHQTARSLRAAINTALETKPLGEFAFMNVGASETHQVRIRDYGGNEVGARHGQGIYDLVLEAP